MPLPDLPPAAAVHQPLAAGARASDEVMRVALPAEVSSGTNSTPLEVRYIGCC